MKAFLCLCVSVLLASPAWADIKITGALAVPANHLVRLEAHGDVTGAGLIWDVAPEEGADLEELGQRLFFAAPPGSYKVKLRAIKVSKDGKTTIETARATVVVGDPVPPPPPVPPVPPGPVPPGPTPPLPPAPIPVAGFRCLIVYESSELGKMPAAQQQVIYAKSVRDYLNAKCVLGTDGKTREWRMWDFDVDAGAESPVWQEAFKRKPAKDKLPWILLSDGKTGYEGPLPATVEETLKLLAKYGGA